MEEDLLSILECPVCMEYMRPPITFCENGHNICNTCIPKLNNCPICRKSFLPARNLVLEELAGKMKYPCCNRKYGCTQIFQLKMISEHEIKCLHQPQKCPFSKTPGVLCTWKGGRGELKDHLKTNHKGKVFEMAMKKMVVVKKFKPGNVYHKVVYAKNEIFYQEFGVKKNDFYFVLQLVGSEESASKYQYEFVLKTNTGAQRIAVRQMTFSNDLDIESSYKLGRCVKLHFDVVRNFFEEEGVLSFEYDIFKFEDSRGGDEVLSNVSRRSTLRRAVSSEMLAGNWSDNFDFTM